MPIMNPYEYTMQRTLDDPWTTTDDIVDDPANAIIANINSTGLELTTMFASALFATATTSDTFTDINRTGNPMLFGNMSIGMEDAKRDFVFDRTDVRAIYITLYSMVFCCCFFGKSFRVMRLRYSTLQYLRKYDVNVGVVIDKYLHSRSEAALIYFICESASS